MSDSERSLLKQWLISVSVVLILQIGSLVWFLASQYAEVGRIGKILDRVEPEHNKMFYHYQFEHRGDDRNGEHFHK